MEDGWPKDETWLKRVWNYLHDLKEFALGMGYEIVEFIDRDLAQCGRRKKGGSNPRDRPLTKKDFDNYIRQVEERIDKKFNERGNRLEGENWELKLLVESIRGDKDRLEAEFGAYRSDQMEKEEKNTAAFRQTEEELEGLRGRNTELEGMNQRLMGDKGDSARQLEEKERLLGELGEELADLRRVQGPQYGFDVLISILEMESAGKQAYIKGTGDVYKVAAWVQRARKAGIEREYIDDVLGCLRNGCDMTKKRRNSLFTRLMEGEPGKAMEILGTYGLIRS
jgi:hypothetical protein